MSRDASVSLHMDERLRDDLERLMIVTERTSLNDLCVSILSAHVYGQTRKLTLLDAPKTSKTQSESQ